MIHRLTNDDHSLRIMQRAFRSPSSLNRVPPPLTSDDLSKPALLLLAYDTLSCVNHRISDEQKQLEKPDKLGSFGTIFDSLLHIITDKLLLKDTWCDSEYFKDILYRLFVVEGEICSKRFWQRWEVTKCTEKGQAGADRWRKHYSARRNLLLFNRRLFCIARPSSVLFGCLSTLNRSGENAAKCLVSEAFIAENATKRIQDPRNVVASRSPFGVSYSFGEKRYACFGRISLGIFFGMTGYDKDDNTRIKTVENPTLTSGWFRLLEEIDPVIYSNPFTEMLEVCKLFEERIENFMKELADSKYFDIVEFSPLQLALANPSCAEIQDLTYFEIVSLLHGFQLSLGDFWLTHDEGNWPEELLVDKEGLRMIVNILTDCMDSFRINVWYSDLHFFFAYFRGKLLS